MGTNVVSFAGANLPAVASLSTALRGNLQAEVSSGNVIIKMDKFGVWNYGADQVEVEEGSEWAINPFSFIHGFVAWGEGELLGEKLVPIQQPLPDQGIPPGGAKRGWELQVGFSVRCMSGEDEGLEARFTTSSVGGKRAVQKMGADIAAQVDKEASRGQEALIVPVVLLEVDSYLHKTYGKIFTPVLRIVRWLPMGTPNAAQPEAIAAPAQQQAAQPAAAAAAAAADTAAPADTGRRRRRSSV